ncbi:MAG TPA: alpha/beta hydrolase, partial [Tepidisphaeraceae bacterium]
MASHYYRWRHGVIHYQRRGMGDPLLLVHNIYPGASWEEFQHNLDALAHHFTVYAVDLLGFGDSDAPRLKYTASTYVELLHDFIEEEIGGATHALSAGLSCAYLTELAAKHPQLFSRLVFICPRSEPTGLDTPRWMAPIRHLFMTTPAFRSGFYDTMSGEVELRLFLRNSFHNPREVTADKVNRLFEHARGAGRVYPYASLITGYLDSRILDWLPRVQTPLLLIWGRQARPAPVEHSVRLVAIARRCRLEVVENAGAWPHDECSALVNR